MGAQAPLPVVSQAGPDAAVLTLKTIVSIVAVVTTLLSGLLMYSNWKYAGRVREARALVTSYSNEAKAANARSELAEIHAAEAEAEAAQKEAEAKTHADQARAAQAQLAKIRAVVPNGGTTLDTLAARLAAVRDSLDTMRSEADSWQKAYESQLEATAKLRASNDTLKPALKDERDASKKLQGASKQLVDATGESFWKRITPKFAISATVGVDPLKPQEGIKKVVGIGASWTL